LRQSSDWLLIIPQLTPQQANKLICRTTPEALSISGATAYNFLFDGWSMLN